MNFVSPLWLGVAGVVAAGVVMAHLFSSTIPPQDVLPTVRFIPESTPLTVMRSRRITDWVLLLIRLSVVALLGFALAGFHLSKTAPRRVVLLDNSRAVASVQVASDSALAIAGGDPIIAFDSSARRVSAEDVRHLTATGARGSLSAATVAAHRVIAAFAEGRGKAELVIVSPLVQEEMDSATQRLVWMWEGGIRLVRLPAATPAVSPIAEVRASGDDPVAATVGPGRARGGAGVRVVRTVPTRADSQWANTGGALVIWPAANEGAVLKARAAADSQGGVASDGQVVVAAFRRAFEPHPGRVISRWTDGAPAATERSFGQGCIRDVAIPVDAVGDVALRESFRGLIRTLLAPCGGARDFRVARLPSHDGGVGATYGSGASSLPLILGLLALALVALEQALRERRRIA